jgi:hypothetical protein
LGAGGAYPAITVTVNVASSAPIQVTNQATVSGGGSPPLSFGDLTFITSPLCDVNTDGAINVTDVQTMIDEALGKVQATHDLDLNGSVRVTDIQLVVNAVRGLSCEAK